MTLKVLILILVISGGCLLASAANDSTSLFRKNVVYIEAFGQAGLELGSINFERRIIDKDNVGVSGRIGFSGFTDKTNAFQIHALGNFLYGRKHHLEIGIGGTYLSYECGCSDKRLSHYGLTGVIGYRFQKPSGRCIFRVGYTPTWFIGPGVISIYYANEVYYFGASFGVAF